MTITRWLRPYRVVFLLLILTAFILRIPILKARFFDPDEFQHLHGARQIYHGQIPYRDYFEHHTPLLHFILACFYPIFGEEVRILFAARSLMMIFTAAILCLTCILGTILYGIDAGLSAALFLSYVIMFLEKTIEVRPDLPAVTFWLASLIFIVKGVRNFQNPEIPPNPLRKGGTSPWPLFLRGNLGPSSGTCLQRRAVSLSWRWFALSGLCVGTATMFSQKVLFALGGLILALIWMIFDRRVGGSLRHRLKLTVAFLGATMVPIVLVCVYFYANRGLWQFVNCNFIMNTRWKVKFLPYDYIRRMLGQNPLFSVVGPLGLLIATAGLLRKKEAANGSFVPILCTYTLLAGLFVIPVPYRQYYLLFLPLLGIYCGLVFGKVTEIDVRRLVAGIRSLRPHALSVGLSIVALGLTAAGLIYTLRMSKPRLLDSSFLYLFLWAVLMVSAAVALIFRRSAYAALLLSIGIIAYPLEQTVDQKNSRNDGQLADVRYIMDATSPEDAVLDGWSGTGFLRQHAYYYFFLHGEMRAMLSQKELSDDLIRSVEERRAKIVIYDGAIKALPGEVQKYISANYVPSGHGNIYIRK